MKEGEEMDVQTGEIVDDTSPGFEKKLANGRLIRLDNPPDPNCKRCYGRGHRGYNKTLKRYVPCKCTKKRKK